MSAQLDIALIVNLPIRVQAALESRHRGDRLESRARGYCRLGGVIVQRRRRQRIPRVVCLNGFPRFGGDAAGKDVRVVGRVAGHGQYLSRLHAHNYYGAALAAAADRVYPALQSRLCCFLQAQIYRRKHVLALDRRSVAHGRNVFSRAVNLNLLDAGCTVKRTLI